MGKISSIFILLLVINIIGYILLSDYVDAYPITAGEYNGELLKDNPMLSLYGTAQREGNTTYELTSNSSMYVNACGSGNSGINGTNCAPPSGFLTGAFTFIDRIFILFGWIRAVIAIALFPVALLSLLGLPWQLTMLLGVPLATLYIFGIIDLFSSSGT